MMCDAGPETRPSCSQRRMAAHVLGEKLPIGLAVGIGIPVGNTYRLIIRSKLFLRARRGVTGFDEPGMREKCIATGGLLPDQTP